MNVKYQVIIMESERGWGQRIDDYKYFDTKKEAYDFVRKYNEVNNKTEVPGWYMYAKEPKLVDLDLVHMD